MGQGRRARVAAAALALAMVGCVRGGAPALTGPCRAVTDIVCGVVGAQHPECVEMAIAAALLPPNACRVTLAEREAFLAAIHRARTFCRELVDRLCTDVGEGTRACATVRDQTPRFPWDRCRRMLENYDAVLADVRCMERQDEPVRADLWARAAASDAPSAGPPDAAVVLVIFSDFQCPYCAQAAAAWEQVRERFAGASVRFVFRQFPLSFHEFARPAAEASLYAASQGRFWEFHDRVFARQNTINLSTLQEMATEAGLSADGLADALQTERWSAAVEQDLDLGRAMCVTGTPSLFIDGERYHDDPRDAAGLSEAIAGRLRAVRERVPAPARSRR